MYCIIQKSSQNLGFVQRTNDFIEFNYSLEHFPTVVANLKAIENLADPRKGREHSSVIIDNPVSIKLSHSLFIVRCIIVIVLPSSYY